MEYSMMQASNKYLIQRLVSDNMLILYQYKCQVLPSGAQKVLSGAFTLRYFKM